MSVCVCERVCVHVCTHAHTQATTSGNGKKYFLMVDHGHKGLENTALEHKFFDHRDFKLSLAQPWHSVCESNDPYFIDEETNS